ncbi:MAG TPA: hypothetical protein VLW85_12255 [Myxococcales bacterium]|nr:hypothetical protein [Myxococcales bacterium]
MALAAALVAVGCSGGTGGGCGSSCGGAFVTQNPDGTPFHYTGDKLANVAQVRVTRSGFNFLNATHLNDILTALNNGAAGGFTIPCIDAGTLFHLDLGIACFNFSAMVADQNFNDVCDSGEGAKLFINFKNVSWTMDAPNNTLKAHILAHINTGDIYVHSKEDHSILCNGYPALMRVGLNDESAGLPVKDTAIDLDIQFSTTPDGRLEFNIPDSSLNTILTNFQPGAFFFDGFNGSNPAAPTTNVGVYVNDGCDSTSATKYTPATGGNLNGGCASVINDLNLGCNYADNNQNGICEILATVRDYLINYVKTTFQTQIIGLIRTQLDNVRCQRSTDNALNAVACDAGHPCPSDDDGNQLSCDAARGVCYPSSQGNANYNCEPIPLAVQGTLDVSGLTDAVGFPPNTKLQIFAGLGSKGSNAATVDANGVQLAAEAGTAPSSTIRNLCVPPALADAAPTVPPMDFDNNKPSTVTAYDVSFSLASAMLNRGFLDAYNAGLLCIAITNKTSSFISSGLFKTFLPSLGLVTGGTDVPMMILLRPTMPPFVRIGLNTTKKDAQNNDVPDDPLITLTFNQMNLDFYALVDQRQVRIFTLQADMKLPLNLRTFPDPNADTLQPVLGGLDTLLTNITAISPDGGAYSADVDMLAEDPGVVKDLLSAAVQLAQPLLAGVIKPVQLPSMLGLKFGVEGIAGAVPFTDIATDGYNHLAVWAKVNECGGSTGVACEQYSVKTQVKVVGRTLPDSAQEVRNGIRPAIDLELSALQARPNAYAQFSYRVDGGLWSAWLSNPHLRVQNPLFLVQGHHRVDVMAREAGDDHTMDPEPVSVDFFVSYEAPKVSLSQRPDGSIVTIAHSKASRDDRLSFSYRVDGMQGWTAPGPMKAWSQEELGGHGLSVSVSDEAGRVAQAHYGEEEGMLVARAGMAGGCTSGSAAAPVLLLVVAAFVLRQRKGSISAG